MKHPFFQPRAKTNAMRDGPSIASKKRTCGIALTALLLSGCEGTQSALWPNGPAAAEIARISWIMFIGAALILLLVMALALYALFRHPDKRLSMSANTLIIAGGVAFPAVTLTALLVYGVISMEALRADPQPEIEIDVVANRWWWDVHYQRELPDQGFTTANEIHIPVGVPVRIRLHSDDVIHSFWVPNLAGKLDAMPGRVNELVIQADRAGVFRGQCAEFCGAQHARMAFFVMAQPREEFDAWITQQRQPATPPADAISRRGLEVLRAQRCVECHAIRGVDEVTSELRKGPDLTHVGSRSHLAAGTLENNRENLKRIIADSQTVKPGNRMPSYPSLSEEDLDALATYLGGLR
jgi:cytochrome c oxidase subunit 2